MPPTTTPDLLITPEEAALRLSIGRTLVYEEIRRGRIESVKIGRRRLIPVDALQQYVTNLRDGGAAA